MNECLFFAGGIFPLIFGICSTTFQRISVLAINIFKSIGEIKLFLAVTAVHAPIASVERVMSWSEIIQPSYMVSYEVEIG